MGHDMVLLVLTLLVPGFFAVTMVFNGLGSVDDNGKSLHYIIPTVYCCNMLTFVVTLFQMYNELC